MRKLRVWLLSLVFLTSAGYFTLNSSLPSIGTISVHAQQAALSGTGGDPPPDLPIIIDFAAMMANVLMSMKF